MSRKLSYVLLVMLFVGSIAFVISNYSLKKQKQATEYTLQPRSGLLAKSAEWEGIKKLMYRLKDANRKNPADSKTALALATLYIREARITGNYIYYDAAALSQIKEVLIKEPENVEAMSLQSMIFLSQHHFAEGLAVAEKAIKLNPHYAFIYGLLIDGNVEMGQYKAAVENSDRMVSLRPDIRSYSRIAYLREIYGDNAGAIEAMKMAVEAGGNGDEPTEWARVQLARLYENTGDINAAEMHYTIALENRPAYAPAIAGLGSIAIAHKEYLKAIKLYEEAASLLPDYFTTQQLALLYQHTGEKEKAKSTIDGLIKRLTNDSKKGEQDESLGHYADRELAYAYLLKNDQDRALKHALLEYNRRPENIDVNETVGWVYHVQGKDKEALPYIETALKTNCKNPTLLCEAGMIYAGTGDKTRAKLLLGDALKNNPNINMDIKNRSIEVLKSI
jgi:tetratricopeptide (TPR) repeat protein